MGSRKIIAKNTIMLYIRMLVNMAISLYTSRVVLQTLGVDDYGIYSVVCGVLSMFTFLNSSMSNATSRFLTYELGRNNSKGLSETFCTALIVHFFIALIIAILCESLGMWFINNKLVIPADRLVAAHWVFQFAVLSMFVSVTQVPYNSVIFSHERMDVYAYVEIANTLLRLLVVYLLVIGNMDKMILFAILNFVVSLFIALYYRYYCVSHFEESKFHFIWNKKLLKDMFSFSGWDLYGNLSVMARTQGINMLMNIFFGPAMNAAAGIATKIQNVVMSFSNNISVASRPQIVKTYAQDKHEEMLVLMRDCARLTFVLMMFFSIPLMVESHYILHLWLGTVPPHTEVISILTLLWNLVVSMNITNSFAVHATGFVKRVSLVSGTLYLMVIPVSYVCFQNGLNYWIPFAYNVLAVFIAPFVSAGPTLQRKIRGYSVYGVMFKDVTRDWCALIITGFIIYRVHLFFEESLFRFFVITILSSLLTVLTAYFIVFPRDRRYLLTKKIKEKIWKKSP